MNAASSPKHPLYNRHFTDVTSMKAAVAEFFAKQGRRFSTAEAAVNNVVKGMFQLYDGQCVVSVYVCINAVSSPS